MMLQIRKVLTQTLSGDQRKAIGAMMNQWGQTSLGMAYRHWRAEACLISFPKCGRTWLRFMLGRSFQQLFNLEHPNLNDKMLMLEPLAGLDPRVPRLMVTHDDDPQWKKPEELGRSKAKYKALKVIFLARDPRDTIVSAYFEQSKRVQFYLNSLKQEPHLRPYRDRIQPYAKDISAFIYEEVGSLNTLLEFYNLWAKNREIPKGFLLVRYEDLHAHPETELARILEFLNLKHSPEILQDAVAYTSFSRMRAMEKEEKYNTKIKAVNLNDAESFKTRKGKVGGFRDYLRDEDIHHINQRIIQDLDPIYGYHLAL